MSKTKLSAGERIGMGAAGAVGLPAALFIGGLSGLGFVIAWPFVGIAGQALINAVKGESDDRDWSGRDGTF